MWSCSISWSGCYYAGVFSEETPANCIVTLHALSCICIIIPKEGLCGILWGMHFFFLTSDLTD